MKWEVQPMTQDLYEDKEKVVEWRSETSILRVFDNINRPAKISSARILAKTCSTNQVHQSVEKTASAIWARLQQQNLFNPSKLIVEKWKHSILLMDFEWNTMMQPMIWILPCIWILHSSFAPLYLVILMSPKKLDTAVIVPITPDRASVGGSSFSEVLLPLCNACICQQQPKNTYHLLSCHHIIFSMLDTSKAKMPKSWTFVLMPMEKIGAIRCWAKGWALKHVTSG